MVALALGTGVDADGRRGPAGPRLVAAPRLAGRGRIGEGVTVEPGDWSGAPALAVQWTLNGIDLPGATGWTYVPVAADDRGLLAARVTASSAAGTAVALSEALAVTQAPPRAAGRLPDLSFPFRSGFQTVNVATDFVGDGLSFSVAGEGVSVDSTGVLRISTEALRDGIEVTVTATNSGGSAAATFRVTVMAPPAAVGTLPDVSYVQGSGTQTVAAAAGFSGADLGYALAAAPAGVTIDAATGVISIPTAALLSAAAVTVRAENTGGAATQSFRITVIAAVWPADVADGDWSVTEVTDPAEAAAQGFAGENGHLRAVFGAIDVAPDGFTLRHALFGGEASAGAPAVAANTTVYTAGARAIGTEIAPKLYWRAADGRHRLAGQKGPITIRGLTAPPAAVGTLPDVSYIQGSGTQTVVAAAGFSGADLGYALAAAPAGVTIDAATGVISIPTAALLAAATVTVRASNASGSATQSFKLTVAVAAPTAVGTLADVTYAQGSGVRTVSAQAGFSGADLSYALTAAPAGVTINAGSGLVSIPTTALLTATVTVRASNASGSATQSFKLTVRSMATSYDAAGKLADLSFVSQTTAPAWSFQNGFARLVPAATSRTHGDWSKAGGDGLYRCLARWTAPNSTDAGYSPFVLGARIARSGANFTGLYVEAFRPASGAKYLRIAQYTGAGVATTRLALARPDWAWNTWYWVELELAGTTARARIYPEAAAAPAWQVTATTTVTGDGAFGPGSVPLNGKSPTVDVHRLEFVPPAAQAPAAAPDANWSLGQIAGS